jgi:hypothetical protein
MLKEFLKFLSLSKNDDKAIPKKAKPLVIQTVYSSSQAEVPMNDIKKNQPNSALNESKSFRK